MLDDLTSADPSAKNFCISGVWVQPIAAIWAIDFLSKLFFFKMSEKGHIDISFKKNDYGIFHKWSQ